MDERPPAEPPSAVGDKGFMSAFAPEGYVRARDSDAEPQARILSPEPKRSFFRGVAVGLAIMIPIWVWFILQVLR